MRLVPVRELQQHASAVLRYVRAGERVGVTDRGVLVAVISPPAESGGAAALIAAGRVRPAKRRVGGQPPSAHRSGTTEGVLDDLRSDRHQPDVVFYLDTSAFLKLLVAEDHSVAMASFASDIDLWSSTLLGVEAHRAALRLTIEAEAVDAMLDAVTLVSPGDATFMAARRVGPPALRTLDALHLAAALELDDDLEGLLVYDKGLAIGADLVGLNVVSRGRAPGWWNS